MMFDLRFVIKIQESRNGLTGFCLNHRPMKGSNRPYGFILSRL